MQAEDSTVTVSRRSMGNDLPRTSYDVLRAGNDKKGFAFNGRKRFPVVLVNDHEPFFDITPDCTVRSVSRYG